MMNVVRRSLTAALLVLTLGGCAEEGSRPTASRETGVEPDVDPSQDPSQDPSEDTSAPPAPSGVVALAVADLAAAKGVDPASVEVVSADEVTWRDGSLGCAQKGMSYTQALVDGRRIVLRVEGTDYEYHSGGSRAPFHCPRPTQ